MSASLVERLLGPEGPVARAMGASYEARGEQFEMASAVAAALEHRSHLLVEAGTGVGKSFAYLVPALVRAIAHGETIVVATHTIALQEQLIQKDLPRLEETVAPAIREALVAEGRSPAAALRTALVKGRGNYISLRRLERASTNRSTLLGSGREGAALRVLTHWAEAREYSPLASPPHDAMALVRDQVESNADNCFGRKCPRHGECFYQRARRRVEAANLLVCNHAIFFSDLSLRARGAGLLPRYDHVIIDEAHNAADVAADHLGVALADTRPAFLLRTLLSVRDRRGFLPHLLRRGPGPELARAVDTACELVLRAADASTAFFEAWHELLSSGELEGGRVAGPGAVENTLTPAMTELALQLRAVRALIADDAERAEIDALAARADEIAHAADVLVDQRLPDAAYWVETRRSARAVRVSVACAPIDVGPILKELLFARPCGVVMTSATLATRTVRPGDPPERAAAAFEHAMARLGCEGASVLQRGSPFDHARQVRLIVEPDIPDPRAARDHPGAREAHLDALAEAVMRHVRETDGGALVLFTSFDALQGVAHRIADELAAMDMPMLVHEEGGPRGLLLAEFNESERAVLLGAASFWQGVDLPGRRLRNVILTRLPFDPPDRPLVRARLERIKARGGDPFMDESLPNAIIRFKQGFGRLIRSKRDEGRVVVLDGRLVRARYGRRFLDALPTGVEVCVERGPE